MGGLIQLALMLLVGVVFVGTVCILAGNWIWNFPLEEGRVGDHPAAPLGCASIMLLLVFAGLVPFSWFEDSDAELYEEIFGVQTEMVEQAMLTDEFGSRRLRDIYLRASPNAGELKRIMAIKGLAPSKITLDEFGAEGDRRGFTWWVDRRDRSSNSCEGGKVYESTEFRDWSRLLIADCPSAFYVHASRNPMTPPFTAD